MMAVGRVRAFQRSARESTAHEAQLTQRGRCVEHPLDKINLPRFLVSGGEVLVVNRSLQTVNFTDMTVQVF